MLKEGKRKPKPNPTRCVKESKQSDLMGDLQLSPTKDTSEAPVATFMAVKGHRMRRLLVIEIRFQHIQMEMFYQPIMLANLILFYLKKITRNTCMRTLLNKNYSGRESAQI